MAIKLRKTLYVGVGGTGVATLLKVKKCFIDSYGEIPPMIRFLAIDTDRAAGNKSVQSKSGETIKLTSAELLVCTVKNALRVYQQASNSDYDWVPPENVGALSGIQGGGAGQVRSNGHFIAYYNRKNIDNSVNNAVNKMNELIPLGSKYKVDVNSSGVAYIPTINVVGSIAGGTGSGMFMDVLCIIRETLENTTSCSLYPWIVLPEIFQAMATGPSMANVFYNTYGALRELDYLMHHEPTEPAINLGYAKIDDSLFNFAYVINNTNSAGVSFNVLGDLTDVIAKSMFLPANEMGDDISTPFDNVMIQKMAGTYNILNKKAWAASTGSAEIIYDCQAVGRVYAHRTIEQLCISMLQSPFSGTDDANRFVDDRNVLIRENNGRNDVITAMLSSGPIYTLNVDEKTTESDINTYISVNCDDSEGTQLAKELNGHFIQKLNDTARVFGEYIDEIMGRPQGKVDAAIKFVEALKATIAICRDEMRQEKEDYQTKNATPTQWGPYLNAMINRGIVGFFKKPDEEAEDLQSKLSEVVTDLREEKRREWAIKFYNEFETGVLDKKLLDLKSLSSIISKIADTSRISLLSERQHAQSSSDFQIFLHEEDVKTAAQFVIDDKIKADFLTFLRNGISPWIGQSQDYIENKLWNFAKETGKVTEAVNIDIDTVFRGMKEDDVKALLERVKILASPLWTYNMQGFDRQAVDLDVFVVVGVGNRDKSLLKQDPRYNTFFDIGNNKASFASTNQNDRVYVQVVEALLPIYAVNNFRVYEYDHQKRGKVKEGAGMANYVDKKLNNRMNEEKFNLMPLIEKDSVIGDWVMGFVLGLIHFDKEADTYWIRSGSRGDAIRNFRFDLGKNRDVAYEIFKSEELYNEVNETFDARVAKTGRAPIDKKVNEIKENGTYLDEVSQLSPSEREYIEDPKFRSVRELVEQEIKLMSY